MFEPNQLLNDKQAAPIAGVQPNTLKNSRHTGKLAGVDAPRYIKMGRSVRYRLEDLQEWLDQFEVRSCTREIDNASQNSQPQIEQQG